MASKAEEASSGRGMGGRPYPVPRNPGPAPHPPLPVPPQKPGGGGGRPLRVRGTEEGGQSNDTTRKLARVNLGVAAVLFLLQLIGAACLCRPVVIMAGLWVAILVLAQAILALHTAAGSSHSLVVGHAWLSGMVCLMTLAAAGYLFSGHLTVACVSTFHRLDHASVVRLYVVEVVGLVASLPCLAAALVALLSAALAARAACPPKPKTQTPLVLYLPRWGERGYGMNEQTVIQSEARSPLPQAPPTSPPANHRDDRANSPPPAYNQIAEESFA
ncbi:uncharacterized protein LOC122250292 [Penaeus japonicus]|uniref:uncharacterized protein LOC122250292 n=1 Tax=Penaeus japonicus TaxID=27405 RepID=UPI001C712088|nr:uncharacterized protein LOC122250292 [Penaeus japonicus]